MLFEFRRKSYTDVQIVNAYHNPDMRIQRFWYEKCRDQFDRGTVNYNGLTEYVRDDLFQDSFIILWEKLDAHQIYTVDDTVHVISRKGDNLLPDLMGYFMRIVKNKYLEMLNSGKFIVPVNTAITASPEDIFDELYWDEDPEVEKDRIVSQCLLSLPKSCMEILTKFYYERMSLEQILAERAGNTSYDGLKSQKSKCMTNLKKRIIESFAKAGLK